MTMDVNVKSLLVELSLRIPEKIDELNAIMKEIWSVIPMPESMRENSVLLRDRFGNLFVYHRGIEYSFEIIKDIVGRYGELREEYLYDSETNNV